MFGYLPHTTKPRKSEPTFTSDSFRVFSKASATIIIFRTEFVDYAPKIKHKISLSPHLNQIERFLAKDISAAVVINAMPAVHRRHQTVGVFTTPKVGNVQRRDMEITVNV